MQIDHPAARRVKELREKDGALVIGELCRRLEPEFEVPVARATFRERFELDEKRRNEVERELHVRKLPRQRHHAVVVLQGVHPHPWQHVLPGGEIFVVRLVHVPQDGDVGHVVSSTGSSMMLRTLDRYVLRELITPFLLALLLLTFALEIPPILQHGEALIAEGASWGVVVRVLATLLPQALGITIP